jgi:hypothetical protein
MTTESVTRRRLRFAVATVALGALGGCLAAEILLRLLGVTHGVAPVDPHPVVHHWHPSNLRYQAWSPTGEYGGFWVHLNGAGMVTSRELAPTPEPGIVLLGDSFVEGMNVPEDERMSMVVERALGAGVFNLGASSFSPLLSRLLFETFRDRLIPDVIVEVLYANDIANDREYRARAREVDGEIVAVPGPTGVRSALVGLARRLYVARFVRHTWQVYQLEREFRGRSAPSGEDGGWVPYFVEAVDASAPHEDVDFTERNIAALAESARRAGARFYLTAVPDRAAALLGLPDFFNEHMKDVANRSAIAYIDLVPGFRAAGVQSLFHQVDIHWNRDGHALAGRLIADRIRADRTAPRTPYSLCHLCSVGDRVVHTSRF